MAMNTTPHRYIRFTNDRFEPSEYEAHELVSEKYDKQVNKGLRTKRQEPRYGRKRPDKFYCEDKNDYRGFRALKDEEVQAIQLADAIARHAK